ncbi:MAG: ATP-binding protein [Syntrophobacterales bacterium]|jgi:signal transduction histidine kinase|nr:ATP-binding protein [Syntrophobacterales bacterium]
MTIRRRIIIAALIQAVVICLICGFGYLSVKAVLTKLQAIEVIDDLNISLLEMRKAEKNYFLYKDLGSLNELIQTGEERYSALQSSRPYLVSGFRGLGTEQYDSLLDNLKRYLELVRQGVMTNQISPHAEEEIRKLGHELTALSGSLLTRERKNVNDIVSFILIMLIVSLAVIFVVQVLLWRYFFRFIIQEINLMEDMIRMVSAGRFQEVTTQTIAPHNEIQIAVRAIGDMARELEKREQELLQSGKLASLGVLISGVAHELGNPLNNISLIAQTYLSLYDLLGDDDKKNYMGDIYTQSERIKKIVENLLDFSRQKKQELQDFQIGDIVQRSLGLVANQLKISKVKHYVTIADPVPLVSVDAPQIQQVLVNLFVNAIQAMDHGGELFIDASYDQDRDMVVLTVRDTGTGIKKEILPNIFDPFFTTKSTKGTGLGLSVSYGIIQQHHGEITVESEEGQGTTFTIKLPAKGKDKGE